MKNTLLMGVVCSALVLSLAGCAHQTLRFPPPTQPSLLVLNQYPHSSAVITNEIGTLTYEPALVGGQHRFIATLEYRVQIAFRREDGLSYAEFQLPMDSFSSISEVRARAISSAGDITTMPRSAIRVRRRPEGIHAKDLKEIIFKVPNAEVGGVIDVAYRRVYSSAELVPPWVFGADLPKMRSEYNVIHSPSLEIDYRAGIGKELIHGDPIRSQTKKSWSRLVFTRTNLPAYYQDSRSPHRMHYSPWVATVVTQGKLGEKTSRLKSWSDLQMRVMKLFEAVGAPRATGTPEERYYDVQKKLSGIDLPGIGIRPPQKAASLLEGNNGACSRDAAAVLYKALQGSRIKAYPALLTSTDGPVVPDGFASFYGFTRAVVAIELTDDDFENNSCTAGPEGRGLLCRGKENRFAFLDPLCADCRYGELEPRFTGGQALLLKPADIPEWIPVPIAKPEDNRQTLQFELTLRVDGSMKGSMSAEMSGGPALTILRNQRAGKSISENINSFLYGDSTSKSLRGIRLSASKSPQDPLRFRAGLKLEINKLDLEKFQLKPSAVLGSSFPGRWPQTRTRTALLDAPSWHETSLSIELPMDYDILEEPITRLVSPYAEYAAGFERRKNRLNYSRRLVIKRRAVDADEWDEFNDFINQIKQIEENGIYIFLDETLQYPEENPD